MLYIFHSTDISLARAKARALWNTLCKKKPDAARVFLDAEHVSGDVLKELTVAQGLFVQKCIVFLDSPLLGEDPERVLEMLGASAASENIFIIAETTPKKEVLALFKKHATEMRDVVAKKTALKQSAHNPFAIADAFAERDAKKLWLWYRLALTEGAEPEALAGMLFWKIKTLLLAKSGNGKKYSEEELRERAHSLVRIYHEAHRGAFSLESALERWILGVV